MSKIIFNNSFLLGLSEDSKLEAYNNILNVNDRYQKIRHKRYNMYESIYNKFDNLYNFKLILYLNDNQQKIFNLSGNNNYTVLINNYQKIKYIDIKKFKLIINTNNNYYEIGDDFNHRYSSYAEQNNNFFIEFSQDYLGYVNCICYYLEQNINNICISPPN
jgi:hypothetical protein